MPINHKSIFTKVKEYKGNPIDEYNKIETFLKDQRCYCDKVIYDLLKANFQKCKLLRANYIDLDDCLSKVNGLLDEYKECTFEYLEMNVQEELLDSFLLYCEIVVCVYYTTIAYYIYPEKLLNNRDFDKEIYTQLIEMIKNSLRSMNYDFKVIEDTNFEVVAYKCNPEVEYLAEQSPIELKDALYYYLGAKENDVKEKEKCLHTIIDLIEPLLKKYKDENNLISKIKEYSQLLRHPELKKDEKQYNWFFNDKNAYLDKLFMLCVFVKEYDISKNTITVFEDLKKETLKN